jgi:hypothetical protein
MLRRDPSTSLRFAQDDNIKGRVKVRGQECPRSTKSGQCCGQKAMFFPGKYLGFKPCVENLNPN